MRHPTLQQPRSRHQGITHKHLHGRTTALPIASYATTRPTGAAHEAHHEFFRGHALGARAKDTSLGRLGDSDYGLVGHSSMSGGNLKRMKKHMKEAGFSFGSQAPRPLHHIGSHAPTRHFHSMVPLSRLPA